MKIALVRPDFRGITHAPDLAVGLLYIAAYLEEAGYKPDVYDLNKQSIPDWNQYDVIAFSMLPLARKQTYELIDQIKATKPETKIVLGGVFPSSIPEYLVKHLNIDAIVVGEGEETFLKLVQFWEAKAPEQDIQHIRGICTKQFGLHAKRPLLDVNKLPLPAWHHSKFEWYNMTYAVNNPTFEANGLVLSKEKVCMLASARGCPNIIKPCSFCNTPLFWQYKYRFRTGANVLKEVEKAYKQGVRVFSFNDDAFPVNKKQCIDFCKGVVKKKMQIAWKSDTRADVLDEEMIQWMKKSGCFMVAIGIESASEKIRDSIHKNLDLDKAKKTIQLLKKHEILAYVLLMVGNIGETEETIMETKRFLIETQPDIATWVTGVMMCAGTELYETARKQGLINDEYWIQKTNGMPIYHAEHSQESLSGLASLLNGWKKK